MCCKRDLSIFLYVKNDEIKMKRVVGNQTLFIFLCKRSKYYFHLYPACLSCLHLLKQEDRKAREKESTLSASTIYL